jgi:signal transduction histidine kinase
VVNLVVNARDAMAGSGRITLRVYACDNDSGAPKAFAGSPARFVCVAVQDDGPGMTERVRRRALEPFYTTKGEAGTGLGLSQVYGFMQQAGGDLTIESEPGRGTTVHLFFRVASQP